MVSRQRQQALRLPGRITVHPLTWPAARHHRRNQRARLSTVRLPTSWQAKNMGVYRVPRPVGAVRTTTVCPIHLCQPDCRGKVRPRPGQDLPNNSVYPRVNRNRPPANPAPLVPRQLNHAHPRASPNQLPVNHTHPQVSPAHPRINPKEMPPVVKCLQRQSTMSQMMQCQRGLCPQPKP